MTQHPQGTADTHCPHCGTELATGTVDFERTPEETSQVDEERATLQPGEMASVAFCPNPDCPGRGAGESVETGAQI